MLIAFQHWCAKNDTNGNPRRLFVAFDNSGSVAEIRDEGYAGRAVVRDWRDQNIPELPAVSIAPSEYNDLVRQATPASRVS